MTGAQGPAEPIDDELRRAGLPALPRTAWLAVDLDRLRANLRELRSLMPPGTPVEPVVKADAYGHGAVPVARALEDAGADGFGVATLDEALELRAGGVRAPILVLYPIPPDRANLAAAERVAITLGDPELTERTIAALEARPSEATLDVHLEIETGLGRGGLHPAQAAAVVDRVTRARRIRLVGVWSHLGSPADPIRSRRQGDAFAAARRVIADSDAADGAIRSHLSASGGLLAGSAPPWDGVRLGLALYGVVPEGLEVQAAQRSVAAALDPVLSLHARPVRVAELAAGTAVSYGDRFTTARPSRIATLPVGYADGYHRARSGRAEVLVRGVRAPVVGTIAMDAFMVDVTDVPDPEVNADDEFVLLGQQGRDRITAIDLAHIGTTISWEVLAGMARRLPRVYYAGAVPVGLRTLTEERGWWTEHERRRAPG